MKRIVKRKTKDLDRPQASLHEKVTSTTEYEALRAEKLFRYEYSNQLNISLLTFAFTVFTAGLLIFTVLMEMGEGNGVPIGTQPDAQTYIVFAEYFFACFFLIPCFFSGINFRYTVKNSLRIGQITEYIREKVYFDDGESWESFKRKYHVNYFYKKPSGVGGARDIPFWINIISCGMSIVIGMFGVFLLDDSTKGELKKILPEILAYVGIVVILVTVYKLLQPIIPVRFRSWVPIIYAALQIMALILFCCVADSVILIQIIIIFAWFVLLIWCFIITPQYTKEIELANCVLEYTREKLRDSTNAEEEITVEAKKNILHQFLEKSTVIRKYRAAKFLPLWYCYRTCKEMLVMLDIDCNGDCEKGISKYINDYLVDAFFKETS